MVAGLGGTSLSVLDSAVSVMGHTQTNVDSIDLSLLLSLWSSAGTNRCGDEKICSLND